MNRRQFLQTTTAAVLFSPSFVSAAPLDEALFYERKGDQVICRLCPHECLLYSRERGYCGAREHIDGKLYTHLKNKICQKSSISIEQLPLYHFLPGTVALSVATPGCTMDCPYCQSSAFSQSRPEDIPNRQLKTLTPEELIEEALDYQYEIIAFHYTEPVVAYEWILKVAQLARPYGIKIVLETNGFIQEKPLRQLAPYLAACKIDLKTMNEINYQKILHGNLHTVLQSIDILKNAGVWIELYTLVIEGFNDSSQEIEQLCQTVKQKWGDIPLFFSRFFPSYKMTNIPSTQTETLQNCAIIAQKHQLSFIYLDHLSKRSSTYCPQCRMELLLREEGTKNGIKQNRLHKGACPSCRLSIPGVWKSS